MRDETKDIFSDTVEELMRNSTIKKQNNKKIRKQKNITFSLSTDLIELLENSWLILRKFNPKATKTAIVEASLRKSLSDIQSIEL